jgi:hypothetical protein
VGNTLSSYLLEDHARLDALLLKSVADPAHFDHEAFERFRSGLLRHIGIEEKLLLPAARKQNGGKPLALAHALHVEHAALASLMVPTPDAALVDEIRRLLTRHNPREEGPEGLYAICESLLGSETVTLLERAKAMPAVRTAPHFDGPAAHRTAESALRSAERAFGQKEISQEGKQG